MPFSVGLIMWLGCLSFGAVGDDAVIQSATCLVYVSHLLQVSALDFSKDREASLHNATLLGGVIKPTSIMLLAAPPENAAAASLPSELLTTEVGHRL